MGQSIYFELAMSFAMCVHTTIATRYRPRHEQHLSHRPGTVHRDGAVFTEFDVLGVIFHEFLIANIANELLFPLKNRIIEFLERIEISSKNFKCKVALAAATRRCIISKFFL